MLKREHMVIERSHSGALPAIIAFAHSWTREDVYARFWGTGEGAVSWLIEHLANDADHAALVAREGASYIGLLDYVRVADEISFGIVVRSEYRRMRVGTRLVNALIALKSRREYIAAQCRLENEAAVGLLRSCHFVPSALQHGELDWEYR
jgi:ribosomal protein S18 acetylase RimI-like enzyme